MCSQKCRQAQIDSHQLCQGLKSFQIIIKFVVTQRHNIKMSSMLYNILKSISVKYMYEKCIKKYKRKLSKE